MLRISNICGICAIIGCYIAYVGREGTH